MSIPASVTHIGRSAFDGCVKLTDVYYGKDAQMWESVDKEYGNGPLINAEIHYNASGIPELKPPVISGLSYDGKTCTFTALFEYIPALLRVFHRQR